MRMRLPEEDPFVKEARLRKEAREIEEKNLPVPKEITQELFPKAEPFVEEKKDEHVEPVTKKMKRVHKVDKPKRRGSHGK